jgi:methylenetetrahydrofolate--tRNA-(uracil-5-)-methyltransferase
MQLRVRPGVFLAGQVSGVEGYVESCAGGFVCGVMLAQSLLGHEVAPPPATTALGGVLTHLGREAKDYQPSNVTWAWLPPLTDRRLRKRERYEVMGQRALHDLEHWLEAVPLARAA